MSTPDFASLGLLPQLLSAVQAAGYATPTPIQRQSIPLLLAGRDLCGTAQTGTGKTAAFALPILQSLAAAPSAENRPRALVMAPTRELAVQIDAAFGAYGRDLPDLRHTVVFGGMKMRAQRRALGEGVDILVATPGRLLDLLGQGVLDLGAVRHFVLDEADEMLALGFLDDVRRVLKHLPARRQNLLFSATMPRDIERLAAQFLRDPARVSVAARSATAQGVRQFVQFVEAPAKRVALLTLLAVEGGGSGGDAARGRPTGSSSGTGGGVAEGGAPPSAPGGDITRALVFVRTKATADRLTASLRTARVRADCIHADRPQPERLRALEAFTRGELRVLVATEIAARGIDVDGVSHVINYDMPNVAESYVHRVGRTARGGAVGVAITFCGAADRPMCAEIERRTGVKMVPLG